MRALQLVKKNKQTFFSIFIRVPFKLMFCFQIDWIFIQMNSKIDFLSSYQHVPVRDLTLAKIPHSEILMMKITCCSLVRPLSKIVKCTCNIRQCNTDGSLCIDTAAMTLQTVYIWSCADFGFTALRLAQDDIEF